MVAGDIQRALRKRGDPERAKNALWFFKTGKGDYGEGDTFIGVTMPLVREVARTFRALPRTQLRSLLKSPVHEDRMCALVILTEQFQRASEKERNAIYHFYLRSTAHINNWDLVDVSCHKIVGSYLVDKERSILRKLAQSPVLWERRIAIVSTLAFVARNDLDDTFSLAAMLLHDTYDLIHKAVGWALREAGKKDEKRLKDFLDTHAHTMPRTALRYAIERLPSKERLSYLHGTY